MLCSAITWRCRTSRNGRADQAAAALRAELTKPLARVNDPATRCRVLTANFRHREQGGEIYTPKVGDIITTPATDAACNVALGPG